MASLEDRYKACMLLGAAGDAMGYKNGSWEFNYDGPEIHAELAKLGGVEKLALNERVFRVSDDTILHIATAEALASDWADREELLQNVATRYFKRCKSDMGGRAAGVTTMSSVARLRPGEVGGYRIPFNPGGGGCGAAMRAAPIGLVFSKPEQVKDLVAVAVESGRMTHHHPTGYLGSLASALFVSFGIQGKPVREWGAGLMETLKVAEAYIKEAGVDVDKNLSAWDYFRSAWEKFLEARGIADGKSDPTFPDKYGVEERDEYYASVSYHGWGGASGHDAPMIAYDALLGAGVSWVELCLRGMLHGGDCDSTGIIAGSAWGALRGLAGVPRGNHEPLEFHDELERLAGQLLQKAQALAK